MRFVILFAALSLSTAAMAQTAAPAAPAKPGAASSKGTSCKAQANDKKLVGVARKSFIRKCEKTTG